MKPQKVELLNVKWDRCARKGLIRIGEQKNILDISFAPLICTKREMDMFIKQSTIQYLDHVHACVIKLHDANDTIKPVIKNADNSSIDTTDFSVRNTYLNGFLGLITIIIDPATDSMKYVAHMKKLATSREVPSELHKFANKMETLRMKKKKGSKDKQGNSIESKIKQEYQDHWDTLMRPDKATTLTAIIRDTLNRESKLRADIGLACVPVIDSEKMLEYTERINRYALAIWPKDEPKDNCATYMILAPEIFSDTALVEKIINYISQVQTKFIVIKFKNLELDGRSKVEETEMLKHLLDAIIKIKHEKKEDKIFVALEANIQMYPLALAGFDIISTSMTGMDGDFPFRRTNKNAINGYFDKTNLIFRPDKYVRKKLANGGFKHPDCICEKAKDYESAHLDWYDIRREHYVRCVNELYTEIWRFIDQRKIELGKQILSNSRIRNLKEALPLLDHA